MGHALEAEECISRACELDPNIAKKHEPLFDQQVDKKLQALIDACRKEGKNPEKDVDFWFGKFAKFTKSKDFKRAWVCLQMAARIGPDYSIMSDDSIMAILPPGHLLLSKDLLPENATVERLRDFYLRMERSFRENKV